MAIPSLIQRSLQHVWHPCTQMKRHETLPLVPIAKAEGVWLYDFEGRRPHTEADIDRLVLALTELARPGSL